MKKFIKEYYPQSEKSRKICEIDDISVILSKEIKIKTKKHYNKTMKKNKERLHDLCYIENRTNLQIIEVPGGEKEIRQKIYLRSNI